MRIRESEEMYLETIYLLQKRSGFVRSIDIAEELNYSRASVSRAVNLLQQKGYIRIAKNGEITFTEAGDERAVQIYERHEVITRVLMSLGADASLAEENACRIEHVISDELFEVLKNSGNGSD
ncbi:MAG: metal-dependent transcriptional regulator [Ruminococcaceae bacterium]|nr:metal-dependent transcriptional regulator [Oscillospiraceae bacterium]